MVKKDFLDELLAAKSSHVKWHAYAQALAMGVESGAEKLPSLYTDCAFGKWYYGQGSFLSFMPTFRDVEPLHISLHKVYMEIYQKYLEPEKKGLFTSAERAKQRKSSELTAKVNQLKDISNQLLSKISEMYEQLVAMDEETLKRRMVV